MTKKNKKRRLFNRKFRMGSFQTIVVVIVVAVVLLLNVVISRLGWSKDLNSDYLYSLSDDTIELAEGLEDDITIYYLVEDGNEAQTSTYTKTINVENIINLYDDLPHITVEKKNPVLYPNFATTYTDEEISDNDVIVVNNTTQKSEYVSFQEDMIEYTYDTSSGSYEEVPSTLTLESSVTAAIQKVTLENTKKVYVASGHNMQTLNDDFTDLLSNNGLESEDLDLTANTEIPEDCDLFIVYAPADDITENEYEYINDYLEEGGKAIFVLNYTVDTPNYDTLLENYGINVETSKGYVLDPDEYFASYGSGAYMLLTPEVNDDSNSITADVGTKDVLAWYSKGMTSQSKVRSTLTVESLIQSSDNSYNKELTDDSTSDDLEQTDDDKTGPFSLAMTATDTHAEDTKGEGYATKILALGSVAFMDAPTSSYSTTSLISSEMGESYGNRSIIVNALTWLVGDSSDEIEILNVPDRSLLEETVQLDSSDISFWTTTLLIVIPLVLLLAGFLVWNRRRKR